jgi:hypothetical protein
MPKSVRDDLDLTREQIQDLSSAEALAAFFADQVVYRLYGLTEEEIAVVEGA